MIICLLNFSWAKEVDVIIIRKWTKWTWANYRDSLWWGWVRHGHGVLHVQHRETELTKQNVPFKLVIIYLVWACLHRVGFLFLASFFFLAFVKQVKDKHRVQCQRCRDCKQLYWPQSNLIDRRKQIEADIVATNLLCITLELFLFIRPARLGKGQHRESEDGDKTEPVFAIDCCMSRQSLNVWVNIAPRHFATFSRSLFGFGLDFYLCLYVLVFLKRVLGRESFTPLICAV